MKWWTYGSLLLTAAICSHHFTAMGAASIIPNPTIEVQASALPTAWLAAAVAFASFGILILTITGMALDIRDRRRTELEADRMRGLANAAVEGLILCDHETIVTINDNFAHLVGIHGRPNASTLATYFPDATTRRKILSRCPHPIEGNLRHHSGETIPVELILRPVEFSGQPHLAIAVRDLRSRRKAEQHILLLAHHDPLTELPNRAGFGKRLEQEIKTTLASEKRLAVNGRNALKLVIRPKPGVEPHTRARKSRAARGRTAAVRAAKEKRHGRCRCAASNRAVHGQAGPR